MRSGAKVAVVGGVFLVVAGGVGYGGYNLYSGLTGGDSGGSDTKSASAPKETGPPSADEVDRAAKDFLAAWAGGNAAEAAQLTNNAADAEPLLAGYRDRAHVSAAVITPGEAVGATVPFTVKATVTFEGQSKPWSYASELSVVRGLTTGRALVDWAPTVVHPKLTKDTTLKTDKASAPPIKAVDRKGRELTKEKYPSLGAVLDSLREKYGDDAGGTAGIELVVASANEATPDQTLLTLTKGKEGTLTTTLDVDVQAAAEKAVQKYGQASVVAIKPSTGEIRAVANSPAGGYNTALQGAQAPGSTMKIVTAAMMMDNGVVKGPGAKVECPSTVAWEGVPFQNLERFEIKNGTFKDSFRRSCNTAFIKAVKPLTKRGNAGTALGDTARKYFGIGLDWQAGIATVDGSVPESAGAETAASYIGQGKITMNALNMASITATAKNGGFHQPVIVPKSLDDRELATAQRLPGSIAQALREMMRATAQYGTGQAAMAGVGGDKGAKTGSAEVDGQGKSNSWFTGYADDLAAAAVVQSGGHGGDAAGPVVAQVLRAR
ncbi:penicillin-binding protein [Streptomyces lunaelactis]|uniref:penicillin-binding transpeptidase domain-containing protein n=1 Tax=Streptomyces lunaelactis TaxID=1535768 RepID=UPI0015852AFD|nr:penicillin-binding transpeptidase domain-containing protein [Streptomyces lunaelactis]NUK36568.1 penicillin-binding protein [Streptomyces lunaelactis]NUK45269.1 penicillin-binding protein [Streptomyces lunaelactis]NUK94913.1 penicillin-binding protein [Streptomyces lunaelactis]NUL32810.1 penicillin-binding protein [Streptomyces lunaelactis]